MDGESGTLDKLQSISTLPEEGFAGDNSTASVRVHPSGKAVYVPNRGHDSIAAFAADSATGLLSSLGHVDSEAIPRPVGIAPDAQDPEGTQFYQMPTFKYEGLYIGQLMVYHTDPEGAPHTVFGHR